MSVQASCVDEVRRLVGLHARLPVDPVTLADDDDLFAAGMTSHASVNVMLAVEEAFDVEFTQPMLRKSTFASIEAIAAAVVQLSTSASVA